MSRGNWTTTGQPGGVNQHYGIRGLHDDSGEVPSLGRVRELHVYIDADMFTSGSTGGALGRAVHKLPAGAKPLRALVDVNEAFVLGGTTPTILVGTQGSEVTNGFVISEAQAEATGVYEITTFAGTWAAEIATAVVVDVALGGTTPTITAAGKIKLVVEYAFV
jgi:hypothetical protein